MVKLNDTVMICLCFFSARVLGWSCYLDNCYYLSGSKMNWQTGVSYCGYIGGMIASIHSHAENQWLHHSLCGKNRNCWIGLNDKYYEGRFRWADGSTVDYTRWDPGQPDNHNNAEHMVHLKWHGTWKDEYEGNLHHVICMKPRVTPSPTREPSYPWPTCQPTTMVPTEPPSPYPTTNDPTILPTLQPTYRPSISPSLEPTHPPSVLPSLKPTYSPSDFPSSGPTHPPSHSPTTVPSSGPTAVPSNDPTPYPSVLPTSGPTHPPSHPPTLVPSSRPTPVPSIDPTYPPISPSLSPTSFPSDPPSLQPTVLPSAPPTNSPSVAPSSLPSTQPTTQAPTMWSKSPTTPTYPNQGYCIDKVKLHYASIVLAGCIAICTLYIILLRMSNRNVVSPKIFSTKTFSPKRFRIERIGVRSKPEEISTISIRDSTFERVSARGMEGIPECEVGETVMTPV